MILFPSVRCGFLTIVQLSDRGSGTIYYLVNTLLLLVTFHLYLTLGQCGCDMCSDLSTWIEIYGG